MQTHQSCSDGTVLMNSEVSYSNPLTSRHDTVSFIVISPARNPDKVSLVTLYISHWLGRNRYDHNYSTKFILVSGTNIFWQKFVAKLMLKWNSVHTWVSWHSLEPTPEEGKSISILFYSWVCIPGWYHLGCSSLHILPICSLDLDWQGACSYELEY